jgi:hypothetical protein
MRRCLIIGLSLALTFPAAFAENTRQTDNAIASAAKIYVSTHSRLKHFGVAIEKIEGRYARVKVTPTQGQTDPAWLFLKNEKGRWIGLILGTGVEPDDYKRLRIPETLWIK